MFWEQDEAECIGALTNRGVLASYHVQGTVLCYKHQPAIGNDLETLARASFTNLTAAEVKICHAAWNGELAFCGPSDDQNHTTNDPSIAGQWGTERHIRADVIRWLCVTAKEKVDPSGIQIFGARIVGALHLSHVAVQFSLAFACCQFSEEINLEGAQTRTLSFAKTYVGTIFADGAVIQGAVFLRDDYLNPALDADGVTVGGSIYLRHGFRADGLVKLLGARIGLNLDCIGGEFNNAPRENSAVRGSRSGLSSQS